MTKRFKEWWKWNNRYITLLKAVLFAALPLVCCVVRCASEGRTIGEVWLPACEWNDELFYFKQVEGIIHYGYPQGYFGFNESHALKLSFAAWSPVLVFPWVIWGLLFGWNLLSPIICNIVLLTVACFLFVWMTRPAWKQLGILTLLFCLFTPFTRYMLSGMPEIICFSMLIVFYALAVNYLNRERTYKLVLLFVMASVMTLMRPYLLLFLLLPAYLWVRKSRLKGALGSVLVIGITLGIYVCIKHYLGAEYFAPLFFTDWVEAFFERGLFGGLRFLLGKLYYMGKGFLGHMIQGFKTGLASGAYFGGYMIMLCILLGQSLTDGRKAVRLKKAGDAQKASEIEKKLIIQVHLAFSFIAMFFALLLMYKLTEGSRHLLTFMAAGIFVVALMETKFFKKAVLLGAAFFYLYTYRAVDPMDYAVPYVQAEKEEALARWETIFDGALQLDTEQETPNYANSVIWTFSDTLPDGTQRNVAWQYLYALPEGFGISCCMPEYVTENLGELKSRYLATLAGGRIDEMCWEKGFREIGRDEELVIYDLSPENSFAYQARQDMERLAGDTYDSIFIGMHSLENFSEEDFREYRGVPTILSTCEVWNLAGTAMYLDQALNSGNEVSAVFMEVDPSALLNECERRKVSFAEQLETFLLSYAKLHPEISFEILLSNPALTYWVNMEPEELATAIDAYGQLIGELSGQENISMFFLGTEYWLIANRDNYSTAPFETNAEVSQKLFLYAFCDGEYRIEEENAEGVLDSLRDMVEKERKTPQRYPDLSAYNIVYFGDSILGYVTGSYSVSGCVSAFSGAGALDCSVSGTAATGTFPDMVSRFLAGKNDIVKNGVLIQEALNSGKKLAFVLNYGLNDYFNGCPIEGETAYDIDSYAGSLRCGILDLKTAFPDAVILLMTPTYTGLFSGGTEVVNDKAGTLTDYVDAAAGVADEMEIYCQDNYRTLGLDEETLDRYTGDATHLNEYGRLELARHIMKTLEKITSEKIEK